MWKAAAGHDIKKPAAPQAAAADDDWETDPDFVVRRRGRHCGRPDDAGPTRSARQTQNDVSEQEQRWGAKTVEGSGRVGGLNVQEVRLTATQANEQKVKGTHHASSPSPRALRDAVRPLTGRARVRATVDRGV